MFLGETRPLYLWFISTALIITATFWSYQAGILLEIEHLDVTKITSVIGLIFIFTQLWLGAISFNLARNPFFSEAPRFTRGVNACAFLSNQLPTLGLIGTVVGFILFMFSAVNNAGATLTDFQSVNQMFHDVSVSMGTALYTTVMGLIGAIILRFELFVLSYILGKEDS